MADTAENVIRSSSAFDPVSGWRVCGDHLLSFHAVFSDLLGRNFWEEDFLFVDDGDGWRFDRHEQVDCAANP